MGIYKSVCNGGMEEVPIRNPSVGLAQELLLEGQLLGQMKGTNIFRVRQCSRVPKDSIWNSKTWNSLKSLSQNPSGVVRSLSAGCSWCLKEWRKVSGQVQEVGLVSLKHGLNDIEENTLMWRICEYVNVWHQG